MKTKQKVAIATLGCKVNAYDTEVLREHFKSKGYEIVPFSETADVYIVNTCTVTHMVDRKSRQLLRRARRLNPDALVIATGCYAQVSPEELEAMPEVDLIVGPKDRDRLDELIETPELNERTLVSDYQVKEEFGEDRISETEGRTRATIKVQDGCRQFCSYCIVPYARGPIRSKSIANAVEEAKVLAEAGYQEVVLSGIHIASFGRGTDETLPELIKKVGEIEGIKRIRLSSLEPTLITEEFLETVSHVPEFSPHFHLSLQSGSDTVLDRMNRHYTTAEYQEIVNRIRRFFPTAGITTDVIVGFPGETDKEFEETLSFVKDIGFSKIHIFPYSPRRGTPAANMPKQVPSEIKKEREQRLAEAERTMREDFYRKSLGEVHEVLFERKDKDGRFTGYTKSYLPIVAASEENLENQIRNVKLVNIENDKITAKIIKGETA